MFSTPKNASKGKQLKIATLVLAGDQSAQAMDELPSDYLSSLQDQKWNVPVCTLKISANSFGPLEMQKVVTPGCSVTQSHSNSSTHTDCISI